MKSFLSAAVAAGLFGCAFAHAGSLVDVSVVDRDTGASLSAYYAEGKYFIAGIPGHRYGVKLINRTDSRVLAVLSVDGVNAISGKTANPDQDGYVLGAYQSTEVDGWRKSLSEVADFNFTALSASYAAKTGRPDNVGVIGVAVFRERRPIYPAADKIAKAESPRDAEGAASPLAQPAAASPAPAARAMAKQAESLGTGHGEREQSVVRYTNFERESSRPNEIDSIWYDSYDNLAARGVVPMLRPHRDPQPFPGGFVPDPAG